MGHKFSFRLVFLNLTSILPPRVWSWKLACPSAEMKLPSGVRRKTGVASSLLEGTTPDVRRKVRAKLRLSFFRGPMMRIKVTQPQISHFKISEREIPVEFLL